MNPRVTWHVFVEAILLFTILMASGPVFSSRWWFTGVVATALSIVSYTRGLSNGRDMMREIYNDGR